MSGIPDIVDGLFKALPSVKKVLNLADRGLDLYNPILASHAAPSAQESDLKLNHTLVCLFFNSFLKNRKRGDKMIAQ